MFYKSITTQQKDQECGHLKRHLRGFIDLVVLPVDNGFLVQMIQSTADLSSVKLDPVFLKARRAHVVGVKLQVPPVHDGQHQTQSVFGLICIR